KRPLIAPQRLLKTAEVVEGVSVTRVRLGITRMDKQRLPITCRSFGRTKEPPQDAALIDQRIDVGRIDGKAAVEARQCFQVAPKLGHRGGTVGQRRYIIRLHPQSLLV